MRCMKWKLLFILTLSWFVGFSTVYAQDYSIIGSNITILHITDEAKTAIEAVEGKENKVITVNQACSQDDFSAICQLGWIRRLKFDFRNEGINDLSPIVNLKGLRELTIPSSKASQTTPLDLTPLAELTSLVNIDFSNTKVTNAQALSSLKNLRKVNFNNSAIDSIDFLKGMPEIRELSLQGVNHTFKDYVAFKKLRRLKIYMNKQATDELLAPLEALTSLRIIDITDCSNITTLNFLKNCKDLRSVQALRCSNLNDISALAQMKFLKSVDISRSKVSDISALEDKAILASLSISETSVSDISALSQCHSLESLHMVNTVVNDFSPLVNCDNLNILGVSKTVPQDQFDNLRSVFLNLMIKDR